MVAIGATEEGRAVVPAADPIIPPRPLLARILVRRYSYRHPKVFGTTYLLAGSWLVVLGAILSTSGFWWGVFLMALGGLELWVAHHLLLDPLPRRVRELERSRARVVDDSAARLRRIEQDLHDGAQAQMVAVAMKLGLAKEHLGHAVAGSGQESLRWAWELVDAAHRGTKEAIAEIRDLARGIHPPVLDEGLGAALATLVARGEVPVDLVVDLPERPSPAIESIAYFCAAELLTNVAKHSGARHVRLEAVLLPGAVRVRVGDDGAGGARLEPGGGLAGLAERVKAVDGTLHVESPAGGPTVVTVALPARA